VIPPSMQLQSSKPPGLRANRSAISRPGARFAAKPVLSSWAPRLGHQLVRLSAAYPRPVKRTWRRPKDRFRSETHACGRSAKG
jgi:hypothetical protein